MNDDEKQALQQLAASAGWTVLKDMMERRLEKAKLEALMNRKEEDFLAAYRHLHATDDAIAAIFRTVEEAAEPVPAVFVGPDPFAHD